MTEMVELLDLLTSFLKPANEVHKRDAEHVADFAQFEQIEAALPGFVLANE